MLLSSHGDEHVEAVFQDAIVPQADHIEVPAGPVEAQSSGMYVCILYIGV